MGAPQADSYQGTRGFKVVEGENESVSKQGKLQLPRCMKH
ncbi:hypothetical protein chiPu_0023033, partial [Chiloscyllium punctatum]|nr:hypothetical protein [Chiloscyllium punctatum]